MPIQILDGVSVMRRATRLSVWDGTRLVSALRVKVMDTDGVTLRTVETFADPLTASASPASVDGVVFSLLASTVTTIATTASPTGGTGPFSYVWTLLSYSHATPPTITTSTNASTTFRQTLVAPDTQETAEFRCTVTDSLGQVATVDVGATFSVYSI